MLKQHTCQQCNTLFHPRNDSPGIFCSKSCNAKYYNALRRANKPPKLPTTNCKECNTLIFSPNIFCTRSCSAKYNNRLRPVGHPSRITSNSQRGQHHNNKSSPNCKVSWCKMCNILIKNSHRVTCSDACKSLALALAGRNSAATVVRRSKDEIALYLLCESHFQSVRNNIQLVNGWDADIIIDDLKLAVLWNGPWHYKQMPHKNHSLSQVQNRDRIKITELTTAGWIVLTFEDRYYSPQTAFDEIRYLEAGVRIERTNQKVMSLPADRSHSPRLNILLSPFLK